MRPVRQASKRYMTGPLGAGSQFSQQSQLIGTGLFGKMDSIAVYGVYWTLDANAAQQNYSRGIIH